jgi:FMN reductase
MADTELGTKAPEDGEEWEVEPGIRIVGVCGSLREISATKSGLAVALEGASKFGVDTHLIELRDYELPFCGATSEEDYPADVTRLRDELQETHGIILGTPEYHGSISGVLKNMLDLMSADQFEGKVVGLLGVAGGHPGAISSLNTMRMIGRNLHCWVLPQEVSIGDSGTAFDADGNVTDPAIEQRLLTLGAQVVRLASLQQKVKQYDFMKMWQGLPTW